MRLILTLTALLALPVAAVAQTTQPPASAPAAPKAERMTSDEVAEKLEKGEIFFLDVREPKELVELGTLEGYVNIPLGQIEKRLAEIPKDKPIVTA